MNRKCCKLRYLLLYRDELKSSRACVIGKKSSSTSCEKIKHCSSTSSRFHPVRFPNPNLNRKIQVDSHSLRSAQVSAIRPKKSELGNGKGGCADSPLTLCRCVRARSGLRPRRRSRQPAGGPRGIRRCAALAHPRGARHRAAGSARAYARARGAHARACVRACVLTNERACAWRNRACRCV
jgi:hypothetical protein